MNLNAISVLSIENAAQMLRTKSGQSADTMRTACGQKADSAPNLLKSKPKKKHSQNNTPKGVVTPADRAFGPVCSLLRSVCLKNGNRVPHFPIKGKVGLSRVGRWPAILLRGTLVAALFSSLNFQPTLSFAEGWSDNDNFNLKP